MNCHSRLLHPTPAPTYATLSAPPIHCTARELVFGDPASGGASTYPNFAPPAGFASRRGGSFNGSESTEGVTHERGKFTQERGKTSHERC